MILKHIVTLNRIHSHASGPVYVLRKFRYNLWSCLAAITQCRVINIKRRINVSSMVRCVVMTMLNSLPNDWSEIQFCSSKITENHVRFAARWIYGLQCIEAIQMRSFSGKDVSMLQSLEFSALLSPRSDEYVTFGRPNPTAWSSDCSVLSQILTWYRYSSKYCSLFIYSVVGLE